VASNQVLFWNMTASDEASYEVVFPSTDGAFSSVLAMNVRRDELIFDVVLFHDCFEASWTFIVEFLKDWFESSIG
jgi:hypothetical protein